MIDYFFNIKDLLPYLYFFPIFLVVIFLYFILKKRSINDETVPFYGLYIGLTTKDIVSLTLLFMYYYLIISSIFVNNFSVINLIFFILVILIFNIINLFYIKIIIDVINTVILFILLYSKSIFYNYMVDVSDYWYVLFLYSLVCLFIFFYVSLIFMRRFRSVISKNKYIDNKIK